MKKHKGTLLLIIFFAMTLTAVSQRVQFTCEETAPFQYRKITDRGGLYITSKGVINTLIVFVQFKNDWNSTEDWPTDLKDSVMSLPQWAYDLASPKDGIAKYYETMSNGEMTLNPTLYPTLVITDSNSSEYKTLHDVNQEVIKELDGDRSFSFVPFDNWSGATLGADGVVDLVYLIYRDFPNSLVLGAKWTGNSSLWLPSGFYYSARDDVRLLSSLERGSGIQLRGAYNGYEYTLFQAVHEFGHKLLGAGHIQYGLANLSLMGDSPVWKGSKGMCAWERERLGWIDYIVKDYDDVFTIRDYMKEGDAVKIKLPNMENEYFILENRQKLVSEYDYAGDKGVYIYHIKGSDQNLPEYMDVECADGNYQWGFDETTLKVTRLYPDPYTGQDEMSFHVKYDSNNDGEKETYGCFKYGGYYEDAAWGDEFDAFDEKYNNVFSPVSNPPSDNGANYPFAVEILEKLEGTGVYKIQLYYSDAFGGHPAKPYGLFGHTYSYGEYGSTSSRATMKWSHFDYDDHDEYEVYRAVSDTGEPALSEYTYVTNAIGVSMTPLIDELDYGDKNVLYYRIKAKDVKGKRSLFSDRFFDWAPPSASTLTINRSLDGHPLLSWTPAESNDVEVFLRKRVKGVWEPPVKVTGTSLKDESIDWPWGHVANEEDFYFYVYKQRRKDLQSPQSLILNAWGEGGDWMLKDGAGDEELPNEYSLSQNYPNPFNAATTIKYQLPEVSHVVLKVYDLLGNEVTTLVNKNLEAGYYSVNLDAINFSSGVYIYRLSANNYTESKKLMLLK